MLGDAAIFEKMIGQVAGFEFDAASREVDEHLVDVETGRRERMEVAVRATVVIWQKVSDRRGVEDRWQVVDSATNAAVQAIWKC